MLLKKAFNYTLFVETVQWEKRLFTYLRPSRNLHSYTRHHDFYNPDLVSYFKLHYIKS
jgi:hypothetical protein